MEKIKEIIEFVKNGGLIKTKKARMITVASGVAILVLLGGIGTGVYVLTAGNHSSNDSTGSAVRVSSTDYDSDEETDVNEPEEEMIESLETEQDEVQEEKDRAEEELAIAIQSGDTAAQEQAQKKLDGANEKMAKVQEKATSSGVSLKTPSSHKTETPSSSIQVSTGDTNKANDNSQSQPQQETPAQPQPTPAPVEPEPQPQPQPTPEPEKPKHQPAGYNSSATNYFNSEALRIRSARNDSEYNGGNYYSAIRGYALNGTSIPASSHSPWTTSGQVKTASKTISEDTQLNGTNTAVVMLSDNGAIANLAGSDAGNANYIVCKNDGNGNLIITLYHLVVNLG